MVIAHSLGFPRIGSQREMKMAVESYWKDEISQDELIKRGKAIRLKNWAIQANEGLELLPVGDFSWYDHVLDMSTLLGVIPPRFQRHSSNSLETYFEMARGGFRNEKNIHACEMTKWFDTNYHYIVPELSPNQTFTLSSSKIIEEIKEAQSHNYNIKPVLLGPMSFLWLSKTYPDSFDKLTLLENLIPLYKTIFSNFKALGIEWVQIDEPILILDLPLPWQKAFIDTYQALKINELKLLLTTYFGGLQDNSKLACSLAVDGLHIDAVRAPEQVTEIINTISSHTVLSVGIINGRNIWKTNLESALNFLKPLHKKLQGRLWIAGSCSFLHCPVDLTKEKKLNPEIKQWLSFAKQKTKELVMLADVLNGKDHASLLHENKKSLQLKLTSPLIHNNAVKLRCAAIEKINLKRNPFNVRQKIQHEQLMLPLFPTTTIGSFPQTSEIRAIRHQLKNGDLGPDEYIRKMKQEITAVIKKQEQIGLDILVHGEAERNDMVEYFGEHLEGFAFTQHGWIQSYGSRCVKPPIIYGDVYRKKPISVDWITYAQSLTKKPVKGMLTGPITMLMWSFVRDDQPLFQTAEQIALALRDEVEDLEKAGIHIIQIDEPAFREGLPLRKKDWAAYLEYAVKCFKLTSSCVGDKTQIHTHMCYSEFNDIIEAIAALDADVLSVESCRSHMEILEAFKIFSYPNEIGPGVYDIHSPQIPPIHKIEELIEKAASLIHYQHLWVNPDCGLKTRSWPEVEAALSNMVTATKLVRGKFMQKQSE